jgi:RNA 2',3'-cyclic 3'-phosphodiesterase
MTCDVTKFKLRHLGLYKRPAGRIALVVSRNFTPSECSCYVLLICASVELSLFSSEPPVPAGLFFSVFPEPPAAVRIAQLAQDLRCRYRLGGRPLLTPRFHSSLYGFDSCDATPATVVAKARQAAAIVTARPFRVSFDCVMSFSGKDGRYPLVLVGEDGVIGLTMLHSSLCTAPRTMGIPSKAHSSFTPHVTLLYDARRVDEQPIESICWPVREFVLVFSLIGRTKHVPLERWQLRG